MRVAGVIAVVVLVGFAAPVEAQQQLGVRAGVSVNPDQFVFGGHFDTAPLVDSLVFRPNAEIGLGNDVTTVSLNFELAYKFLRASQVWTPYVGAGPALNIYRFSGNTDSGGGFNMLFGAEHIGGLFTEVKVGAIDSP